MGTPKNALYIADYIGYNEGSGNMGVSSKQKKEIITVCLYGVMGMLLFIVATLFENVDHKIASAVLGSMQISGFILMVLPVIYMKMWFIKDMNKNKGGDV